MKLSFSLLIALQMAGLAYAKLSPLEQHEFERELFDGHRDLSSYAYGINFFADSQSTYYDSYQTAWRYLGHMVKCGYPSSRYDGGGGGSQDGNYAGNNYCQRFLLWAAYVDPNYQGGGTGEYYYYDTSQGGYDQSACQTNGNGRCAPMDCHDSNTETWKLLGIYKEAVWYGGDAFFEQLFKHEGYCLWNNGNAYEFMSNAREKWTTGCVGTGDTDENGNYIYIDLKPGYNGNMYYGLYVDEVCKTEYNGNYIDVDTVASAMGLLSTQYVQNWNQYMEPFKVCQPCRAYNLNSGNSNNNNNNNGGDGDYDKNNDPNNGYFKCNDDAGYTNVNQCMKFRSHGNMEIASWEDLVIGTEQGGILEIKVGQTYFGSQKMSYEQAEYLEYLMQQKAKAYQQEEQQYEEMVKDVPSATPMTVFGIAILASGAIALVGSIIWGMRRATRVNKNAMAEPLILRKLANINRQNMKRLDGEGSPSPAPNGGDDTEINHDNDVTILKA